MLFACGIFFWSCTQGGIPVACCKIIEPQPRVRGDCVGTWLSLVEHSLGVRGVGSSNLPVPTKTSSPTASTPKAVRVERAQKRLRGELRSSRSAVQICPSRPKFFADRESDLFPGNNPQHFLQVLLELAQAIVGNRRREWKPGLGAGRFFFFAQLLAGAGNRKSLVVEQILDA